MWRIGSVGTRTALLAAHFVGFACLALAVLLTSVSPASAALVWERNYLGNASDPGVSGKTTAVWNDALLAWPAHRSYGAEVTIWDAATNRVVQSWDTSDTVYNSHLHWRGDRVYWLQQRMASGISHFEVLSMAVGDSGPRVELSRDFVPEGRFEMGGDRILWTEWHPSGTSWSIMTKLLSDPRVEELASFRADIEADQASYPTVNVGLTRRLLVWSEEGSRTLSVIPLEDEGALGTPIRLEAGGANSGLTGLAADDDRVAWSTTDLGIHTWQLGDKRPRKIFSPRYDLKPQFGGSPSVAVADDVVAWTVDTAKQTRVMRWTARTGHASTLVTYRSNPPIYPYVSAPSVNRDRVAWAVSYGTVPYSNRRVPAGFVATWSTANPRVQRVFTTERWFYAPSDAGVAVGDDMIAFMAQRRTTSDPYLVVAREVPGPEADASGYEPRVHEVPASADADGREASLPATAASADTSTPTSSDADGREASPPPSAEPPLPENTQGIGLRALSAGLGLIVALGLATFLVARRIRQSG